MKPEIHPKYFPNARVVCACGHAWTTGATLPEIRVDVCSNCHPFYTGEQRIVDTAGRVDRFRMRLAQKRETKKADKTRKSKVEVIGPDEPAAPLKEAEPMVASAAVAEAEQIVNAPVAKPAEAVSVPEAEAEPEIRVRTVVEGASETVLADDEDDAKPKRRAAPRKPRARRPAKADGGASSPPTAAAEPSTSSTAPSENTGA